MVLFANAKLLVRFDLSEFLINRNHDWHGKIINGLIMPNEDVHDRTDINTAKFYGSTGIQAFQRGVKVKNSFELRVKETARTEDEETPKGQYQPNSKEQTDDCRIRLFAHSVAVLSIDVPRVRNAFSFASVE